MGKPIIWSGVNAKLINSGDLIDKNNLSLTNGDKITVTQASHGFTSSDVGRPLYLNSGTWTLAIANASATAEVAGFIYSVLDANTLRISTSGQCPTVGANFLDGGGSLVAGEVYFLSPTTAGKVSVTEPSVIGQVSKPVGVATSTTAFQFFNFRGSVVGGANARTQISLSNNTTANVQNVSLYDAGEIVGWVYIDAGTDYRFLIKAQFAKTGAGTNWNLSYQTVGDTPPAGFSFSITSAGVIQYTMPSLASFSTALFNYALNAPAVGTSFPLSVSGTNVVGGTPTIDTVNEYTSTNGVQIQGRTSGTAISSGYIGQNLSQTAALANMASGSYNAIVTVNMTAGIYLVSGILGYGQNSATITGSLGVASISTNNRGYSTADKTTTSIIFHITNYAAGGESSVALPQFLIRVDGSNIYFPNGITSTGDRALKLAFYPGTFTGGPVQAGGSLYIVRIA
jgi:hypothetical protein